MSMLHIVVEGRISLLSQIEKMRVELLEERERVGVLETEFASAFETELRNISSTYIKAAVEDTANLLEKLKKDLTVSEREKAVLMVGGRRSSLSATNYVLLRGQCS